MKICLKIECILHIINSYNLFSCVFSQFPLFSMIYFPNRFLRRIDVKNIKIYREKKIKISSKKLEEGTKENLFKMQENDKTFSFLQNPIITKFVKFT